MKELVLEVENFNLKYTLECGQCFRWKKIDDNLYIGVISDRVIKIKQEENKVYIKSNNEKNLENVVKEYFDLFKDYKSLEQEISKIDINIKKAVKNTTGIRILNQDFFEILISYIISANNNIPRISKSVKDIAEKYGKKIEFENRDYFLFPTSKELENISEENFKKCGVGFRARYVKNTVKDIICRKIDIDNMQKYETSDFRNSLMKLQGVGPKVADCILLFSCKRPEVFPIDVWVERVMQILYFKDQGGIMKKKDILNYAKEKFGENAGIIQQHLFYNMREKMI